MNKWDITVESWHKTLSDNNLEFNDITRVVIGSYGPTLFHGHESDFHHPEPILVFRSYRQHDAFLRAWEIMEQKELESE